MTETYYLNHEQAETPQDELQRLFWQRTTTSTATSTATPMEVELFDELFDERYLEPMEEGYP